MRSFLQPVVAAVMGLAGLVLSLLLLPLILAVILAVVLVGAGALAFTRWRLEKQLRAQGPSTGAPRARAGGRVIEAEYEVIRER